MKTRYNVFGQICLWASLAALYALLAMKLVVLWREGLWLDWPLGNYLPDAIVRWVFSLRYQPLRSGLVWALSRDVVYHAAAISFVIWLLGGMFRSRNDAHGMYDGHTATNHRSPR